MPVVEAITAELRQMTGIQRLPNQSHLLSSWTKISSERAPEKYLVFIEWDEWLRYLTLRISAGPDIEFFSSDKESTRKKAKSLFHEYGYQDDQIPTYLRDDRSSKVKRSFLIGEVLKVSPDQDGRTEETKVNLECSIDTDDVRFREDPPDDFKPVLAITSYFRQPKQRAATPSPVGGAPPGPSSANVVRLELASKPMPKYEGYVAIDFGNTNSELACMGQHAVNPDEIAVIGELGQTGGLTTSAVRIRALRDDEPKLNVLPEADYDIGDKALRSVEGTLVLGSKRLYAAPTNAAAPHYRVPVIGGQQARNRKAVPPMLVPRSLPAELFVTGMIRRFHAVKKEKITRLAVTYPSTFSEREQAELKKIVFRAMIRAQGVQELTLSDFNDLYEKYHRKWLPLFIDEASAAALYFIYSDFICARSSVRGLRYQYPDGINILLYDCGGGTTDLALVRLRPAADLQNERAYRHLHLQTLGRSGMRGFGGDNITLAVFRLLKAKLAILVNNHESASLQWPSDLTKLKGFLDNRENREHWDSIPTRLCEWPDDQPDDAPRARLAPNEIQEREENHLALWLWAESFKKELSKLDVMEARVAPALNAAHVRIIAKLLKCEDTEALGMLENIAVSRAEVEVLIRDDVIKSIEKGNRMIAARLEAGQQIHRVYVVGNASRYPLIRELLRQRLRVPFVDDVPSNSSEAEGPGVTSRFWFDEDNLKHAVAKGAVLALRLEKNLLGLTIADDRELMSRLPYHIGYRDQARGTVPLVIYDEHEKYPLPDRDIAVVAPPGAVPIPAGPGRVNNEAGRQGTEISLWRLWPGDTEQDWEQFVDFQFKQPVNGLLHLKHDSAKQVFKLTPDGAQDNTAEGVEKGFAEYISPAQKCEY